jgi:8-oxo-dGTP diphosphatase
MYANLAYKLRLQKMLFKLAVDCIILAYDCAANQLVVLLVRRENEPAQGQWALPGGFVTQTEDFEATAARKLRQETGVEQVYLEQLRAYSLTDARPGQRLASIAYYALIELARYAPTGTPTHQAAWFPVAAQPALPFDHGQKVQDAVQRLRESLSTKPLPYYLLPRKFPLNQLQKFYEAIHQVALDNRNFRKWVKGRPYIEMLNELETNVSHRPGRLYQFNQLTYDVFAQTTQGLPY